VLKRSSGTDQITFELSRIADALERIANRPADDAIAAASRRQQQTQTPPAARVARFSYSMFGRRRPSVHTFLDTEVRNRRENT